MFKYLRNINGSAPNTEIVTFNYYQPEEDDSVFLPGSIVTISAGGIDTIFSHEYPAYLVISVCEKEKTANCIKIIPGMVFEADIASSVSIDSIYVGSCCGIYTDDLARGTHLGASGEENFFQVIDNSNKNKKKATVVVM